MTRFTRWNSGLQLGVLMSVVVIVTAIVVGTQTYSVLNGHIVEDELEILEHEAILATFIFEDQLISAIEDVRFLSATPPSLGYLRALRANGIDPEDGQSTPEQWLTRMTTIFRELGASRPVYLQLRYISTQSNGKELLRFDRLDQHFVQAAQDDLQEKGSSAYFLDSIKSAKPGNVYLSRIELNQEFNEIDVPPEPVLRVIMPLFLDQTDEPAAMIVINIGLHTVFDRMVTRLPDRKLFIVNQNSDFLVHPDPTWRFSHELGHDLQLSAQWRQFSDLAQVPSTFTFTDDQVERAVGTSRYSYDRAGFEEQLLFAVSGDFLALTARMREVWQQVVILTLGLTSAAIVFSLLIGRLLTRTLRSLATSASSVARGHYDLVLPPPTSQELSILSNSMGRMARVVKSKIDELARKEIALRDQASFLESIIDNVPTMVFIKDAKELRFVRLNKAAEEISGFTADEMVGKSDYDLFPKGEADSRTNFDQQILKSVGVTEIGEEFITRKDGAKRVLHTRKVAIRDQNDTPIYLLGISEDITDEVESNRQLQKSESRFRAVAETAGTGILIIDKMGIVGFINGAAASMFGYSIQDVLGNSVSMLMPRPDSDLHDSYLRKYLDTGVAKIIGIGREVNGRRRDGSEFPLWLSVSETDVDGEKSFTGIIRNLVEEKEAERQTLEAKELAETASHQKSRFLATMSHELRTPLNAIIGYSEMLLDDVGSDSASTELIEDLTSIQSAGKHLLALVNDILDLSKIEEGTIELEITPFNITEVVEEVAEALRPIVESNRNHLKIVTCDLDKTMHSDPTRVRQILWNLLSNAAKFTTDGKITVALREEDVGGVAWVAMSVQDTGIGIGKPAQARIFEAFSQADVSTTRRFGGTGLGLAIVSKNCALLGGHVDVSSVPGEGSEFTVHLPATLIEATAGSESAAQLEAEPGD